MKLLNKLFPVKIYTIGRAPENDIVESNDMISRYHAVLKVYPLGKSTITDNSLNGTFVNGRRLDNGIETEVKRSDSISFAEVSDLDWKRIPKPQGRFMLLLTACVLLILLIFFLCMLFSNKDTSNSSPNNIPVQVEQATKNHSNKKKNDKKIGEKNDSITNKDSVNSSSDAYHGEYKIPEEETGEETDVKDLLKKNDNNERSSKKDFIQDYLNRNRKPETVNKITTTQTPVNKGVVKGNSSMKNKDADVVPENKSEIKDKEKANNQKRY